MNFFAYKQIDFFREIIIQKNPDVHICYTSGMLVSGIEEEQSLFQPFTNFRRITS